ncbi:MAG: cobalt ECF transporter T component CbiQ [Pyrinomonadaceae bacterium]|nr:cobalt ECF transporter T component CbiQ [Pyrinomonadaceae bacterium]
MESTANISIKTTSRRKRKSRGFIERTLFSLVSQFENAIVAEEIARKKGLLQSIDPRVKIIGLVLLIIDATLSRNIFTVLIIFAAAVFVAILSKVSIKTLATRAWLSAFTFTGAIALPAIFTTAGDVLFRLPLLNWAVTEQGVKTASFLLIRVETTVTLSFLLVLCTLWTHILKALRVLGVPVVFVVILGMTYRYIFVMLETARNMFEARQSRLVGTLTPVESRRIAAASVGVLMTKSFYLNNEVYLAMQSRGFRGEVYTLDDFKMKPSDWIAMAAFVLFAAATLWLGQMDNLIFVK